MSLQLISHWLINCNSLIQLVSPQRKEAFDKNVRQPFLRLLLENLADRFPQIELLCAFDAFDSQALPPPSATEEDREKATAKSLEQLQLLLSHYGTGDDAPLNAEELHKEWKSFSILLADHYSKAKTKDVLHNLAI